MAQASLKHKEKNSARRVTLDTVYFIEGVAK